MAKFSDNLKLLRLREEMTQAELAQIMGISSSTIGMYEQGRREPDFETLESIADIFNVNISTLIDSGNNVLNNIANLLPITTKKIPLIGEISCGELKMAREDFESYIDVGSNLKVDFALRANGDSMINIRIHDGDIVFIKQTSEVNNGDIAVVLIGDEATLKRFNRYGNIIVLSPENPAYEPIEIRPEDNSGIRILGKAIAFQSDIK